MKLFNTIFYHFYLFYKNSKVEDQPISTAIFSMSFIQSFYVICFIDYYLSFRGLLVMNTTPMIIIWAIILAFNFAVIYRKAEEIIDAKPMIRSRALSKIISISFFTLGFLLFVTFHYFID